VPILPADVKKAVELLRADPSNTRSIDALAAACGVTRRTLEKHFHRFLGRPPVAVRRDIRLDRIRYELFRATPSARVADIAMRYGEYHLGRFAANYRKRYGETPSATLERRRSTAVAGQQPAFVTSSISDRPVLAVQPFDLIGQQARLVASVAAEIEAMLLQHRWLAVGASSHARYHLRGSIRDDGGKRLRIVVMLADAASGRYLWADRWEGEAGDAFAFTESVAVRVAVAVGRSVRQAEIDRASRKDPAHLRGWELTMRALPRAFMLERAPLAEAIELLERAMEMAPHDPLPAALAAWCRVNRGTHHLAAQPLAEKQAGHDLALRAARINSGDALVEALLGAAYTLVHDLTTAARHCQRAVALDGSCAWAWVRSGLLAGYLGKTADAFECLQVARGLGLDEPGCFLHDIGMGVANFEIGRYGETVRWWQGVVSVSPQFVWMHRFMAPAYALADKKGSSGNRVGDFGRV